MGNCRFRLSDMMPNSWFYKLRDMSRPGNQHKTTNPIRKNHTSSSPSSSLVEHNYPSIITKQPPPLDQRKSYHSTRDFPFHPNSPSKIRISHPGSPPESPRRSSRRRTTKRNRPPKRQSSIHAGCSCRAALESVWTKFPDSATEECPNSSPLRDDQTSPSEHDPILPEHASDRAETPNTFDDMVSLSTSCKCKAGNDIVINVDDNKPFAGGFDRASGLDRLPPIITKKREPTKIRGTSAEFPEKDANGSLPVKVVKDDFTRSRAWSGKEQRKTPATPVVRRYSANSSMPGVKLRSNSPRIGNRRIQGRRSCPSNSSAASRRRMSESFAVVKSSKDPRRDFRKSMMEMIVENNIRTSKDLEELLACYLSLNSDEYHGLIINVFKQIWFDFIIHLRLK